MVMLRETSCRHECSFPTYYYYYYSQLNPRLWKYIDVWNQYFMWHYITLIFPRFSIGGRGMQVGARADKMSTRILRIMSVMREGAGVNYV